MNELYPTFSVGEAQSHMNELFKKAKRSPIVILSRATPKLVCTNPDEWNRIARTLEDQEDIIAALKAELALAKGETEAVEITDADAGAKKMMGANERVPA